MRPSFTSTIALVILVLFLSPRLYAADSCCGSELEAWADARLFDDITGRDTRQYPPHPQVDFTHIKLDVRMPDPTSKSFTCVETISFKTLGLPIAQLKLDAVELRIESVSNGNGKPAKFHHDDRNLFVDFDPELPPHTEVELVIEYTCTDPTDGMIFAIPDDGYPDRPLMIHTQGQTESNRHWFVAHDYPNERCTTEIITTVPSKFSVLSNGKLLSKEDAGDGMTRWHYRLGKPHVSYLVSLVIGEFDVVSETWRDIPVSYWVPPGQRDGVARTFGTTTKMLDLFSRLTGVDYPYEQYAQSVVYLFSAGGMENTSTTTLHEMSVLDERAALDQDLEGLISHELAHQWYGDMITCKSWAHIWLNEGFATYFSSLWSEYEHGRDEYDLDVWQMMRSIADASAPDSTGGMAWFYYDNAWDTFRRRGNSAYSKGASVLHMLRQSLGDELFFKAIAEYTKRHAWDQVESDDLRKVIEELSGRSYEQFFQQWVYRSGVPEVTAKCAWTPAARQLTITLEQRQEFAAHAPAFATELAIWLVDDNGSIARHSMKMDGRTSSASFAHPTEPAQVVIDPNSAVLMKIDLDLPIRMLIAQAAKGPTTISRLSAIAALSKSDRPNVRDALRQVLVDEKLFHGLRSQTANSLGKMQSDAAREILLEAAANGSTVREHRTRRSLMSALGQYRHPDVAETLIRFAKSDPSYAVEAEATEALGRQDPTDEVVEVLVNNAEKLSWRDQIRSSAVESLAQLGDPRGIEPAQRLAAYGQPFRTRPTGIEALGRLGRDVEEARDQIRIMLIDLTRDPQQRSANAAIRALGELGDEKAIPDLEKVADSAASARLRATAREAIEAIRKAEREPAAIRSLRQRIDKLERQRPRDDAAEEKNPLPASRVPATMPAD